MIKTIQGVKDKLKIIAREKNIDFNSVMRFYMYDRFIERLSRSKYKDNFILKGGLLLSAMFGIDNRMTKDMDATLKSIPLKEDTVLSIMSEILNIDIEDNVSFEIVGIKDIREEDEYGGFKINIIGKLERLRVNMFVELTTGDKITPKEIKFNYNCIFNKVQIPIFAYTLETVVSEKFETIISRNITTTRLKDFYDLGILLSDKTKKYDEEILIEADVGISFTLNSIEDVVDYSIKNNIN